MKTARRPDPWRLIHALNAHLDSIMVWNEDSKRTRRADSHGVRAPLHRPSHTGAVCGPACVPDATGRRAKLFPAISWVGSGTLTTKAERCLAQLGDRRGRCGEMQKKVGKRPPRAGSWRSPSGLPAACDGGVVATADHAALGYGCHDAFERGQLLGRVGDDVPELR